LKITLAWIMNFERNYQKLFASIIHECTHNCQLEFYQCLINNELSCTFVAACYAKMYTFTKLERLHYKPRLDSILGMFECFLDHLR